MVNAFWYSFVFSFWFLAVLLVCLLTITAVFIRRTTQHTDYLYQFVYEDRSYSLRGLIVITTVLINTVIDCTFIFIQKVFRNREINIGPVPVIIMFQVLLFCCLRQYFFFDSRRFCPSPLTRSLS